MILFVGRRPEAECARVLERLRVMAAEGIRQPGQRFLSNRYVAGRFGVSYQTAHRLLKRLEAEGALTRRTGSGTFVAGEKRGLTQACLMFARRATRAGSFGAFLLAHLEAAFTTAAIPYAVRFGPDATVALDAYPLFWELPTLAAAWARQHRFCLVLHDRPPPGLASLWADALSVDDYGGGMAAAEILGRQRPQRPAVVTGPARDRRSQLRVQGFLEGFPCAETIAVNTWFLKPASRFLRGAEALRRCDALFCCSDRLAEAALAVFRARRQTPPPLVGFDNAPIAETLSLTTVGIPWAEVARHAVEITRRRLAGGDRRAAAVVLPAEPEFR